MTRPQPESPTDRLPRQLAFLLEVDKLKHVLRQTLLIDGSRRENDAEHSWHLAVMAVVLAEYANEPQLDIRRVVEMVIVHDLVEIDAGDTFCYDAAGHRDKAARETRAADRIFAILPPDQAARLRALWDEFEAKTTPEARFAGAIDRFHPLFHNSRTHGHSWRKHHVTSEHVLARNAVIADGSETLWTVARELIREAIAAGDLMPPPANAESTA